MNLLSKWLDFISTLIRMSYRQTNLIWLQLCCPESEDRCDSERPVNSSIIWCLSCLIKHIIDHPRTNDSHPITNESNGFGITTTWPRCGLTGLRYRVRVYPPFTAVTLLETALHHRMSQDVALSSAKNSWREKCNYCKIIILLPFDFSDWIHEYIWIHLASQSGNPHIYVLLVAFSLFPQSVFLQED